MTRKELALLFPRTDPVEVERAIALAMERLSLGTGALDQRQVLAVLDAMTSTPGVVGVAARFAKARALLLPKPATAAKR